MADPIALVLAGGGARGAYEIGALSVILPALPVNERPNLILGTSVGALNGAYLAATLPDGVEAALEDGRAIWESIRWGDVLDSPSFRDFERLLRGAVNFTGLFSTHVPALLDATPVQRTLERVIPFDRIQRNVDSGAIAAAAVVATSAHTGRSVVFHHGGKPDERRDDKRGIDYVATELREPHVRASAAIPAIFPAVEIEGGPAPGWYFDGGTRLNAPIKPALSLGARRVIVIGLNSIASSGEAIAGPVRPDLFGGAGQIIDALLTDPLVEDIQTLTTINELVASGPGPDTARSRTSSSRRRSATRSARSPATSSAATTTACCTRIAPAGRVPRAAIRRSTDAIHAELLSYLFFAPEFCTR